MAPRKRKRSDNVPPSPSATAIAGGVPHVTGTTTTTAPTTGTTTSTMMIDATVREKIDELLDGLNIRSGAIQTKSGWCLRQGLYHIGSMNNQMLLPRICHHGVPTFYLKKNHQSPTSSQQAAALLSSCRHEATQDLKDPQTCFQSLCRIIAGQFVSGKSAQAAWSRLLCFAKMATATASIAKKRQGLTPQLILTYKHNIDQFQKMVGLTKAKTRSILDLAEHFQDGRLSEEWLQQQTSTEISEEELRKALLQVRGIGDWSCDMFLLFYLERPNVLPLGDLGVRKGIANQFFSKANVTKTTTTATTTTTTTTTKKKTKPSQSSLIQLCPKKDATKIHERVQPFSPYYSLLSYYMWRVADTPIIIIPPLVPENREEEDRILEKPSTPSTGIQPTPPEETTTKEFTKTDTTTSRSNDAPPSPLPRKNIHLLLGQDEIQNKSSAEVTLLLHTNNPRKSKRLAIQDGIGKQSTATVPLTNTPSRKSKRLVARTVTP